MRYTIIAALVFVSPFALRSYASTAAFQGTITEVRPLNQKDALVQFTCSIDYFDYISWGKFNSESKTGELITRRVKKIGTAAMIDGRLVNVATFSKAIKPGQWGYFYEDTWLDLRTTPNFKWGEVVSHDPEKRTVTLRVHRTHKQIHLEANPPQNVGVSYDAKTMFRDEGESASRDRVLLSGNWVQVHPARKQIMNVWSTAAKFDSGELLPADQGKRGYANDLTAPSALVSVATKTPNSVTDLSCDLTVSQIVDGKRVEREIHCRKTSFVLDGKLCPARVAVREGRYAVLGHYRSEKSPHKVFVRSRDDAIRGVVKSADGNTLVVESAGEEIRIVVAEDAETRLDGVASNSTNEIKPGNEVTVYPQRGPTIISFGK